MSKKFSKTFGAQVDPTITEFLAQAQAHVDKRRQNAQADGVEMPGNSELIRALIKQGPGAASIIDFIFPPPAQAGGQENSPATGPLKLAPIPANCRANPAPTSQCESSSVPDPVETWLVATPLHLTASGTAHLAEEAIPAGVTATHTTWVPATKAHIRGWAILAAGLALVLSALILGLSVLPVAGGYSDINQENQRLRARLAAMEASAQNQAATSGAKSKTNATSTASHPDASIMPRGSTASKSAAESVIDVATINDLRAANAELREKLKVWEKMEPLIVKRLNADAATIDALTREIAKLKSAHTRIGPQVVGSSEGRP